MFNQRHIQPFKELFIGPLWILIQLFHYRRLFIFPVIVVMMSAIFAFKSVYMRNSPYFFVEDPTPLIPFTEDPPPPLLPGLLKDPSRTLTRKLPISHAFIVNAYYFPESKSLGKNAIAINMLIDAKNINIEQLNYHVLGSNGSFTKLSVPRSEIATVTQCRYASALSIANTVENLNKLEVGSNGVTVEIPFKMARNTAPKPVIICISPQFVAEQWQLFLMQVHVSRRFDGHLHIYLTSIIKSYFKLMKEYEKLGYVTVDYWLRMKFANSESAYFEPNANAELQNRVGAQMDCLLQYKEAAKYIAFFDLDDLLFPTKHSTYLSEFNAEWKQHPNASSLYYLRKEHNFAKAQFLYEFSFKEIVTSLRTSDTLQSGRVVLKSDQHNFTWIQANENEPPTTRHTVEENFIIHVQRSIQENDENEVSQTGKIDFVESKEKQKIRSKDVNLIENDMLRIKKLQKIKEIGPALPSTDFYMPILVECYYNAFNNEDDDKSDDETCPNAELCEMPQREDYKCVHSDAEYISGPFMKPFTFHFSNNSFWSDYIGCFQ